jgi:uncharacterized protein (DUF488 family)
MPRRSPPRHHPARTRGRRRLYTIGHSTRTLDELVAALRAWDVETLVDIRHFTRSRANPQFGAGSLRRRLARDRVAYVAMQELGGRRPRAAGVDPDRNAGWRHVAFKNYADYAESPAFQRALAALLALARRRTCAIMCAEAVWWRCHRRIVADYALTRRVPVWHVFTARKATPAVRTSFARYDHATRTLRYPLPSAEGRRATRSRRRRPKPHRR